MRIRMLLLLAVASSCGGNGAASTGELGEQSHDPSMSGRSTSVEFPLKTWMNGNASGALRAGDAVALERAFVRIETMAPEGYDRWATIAQDGVRGARSSDVEGCRRACQSCHEAYRAAYRKDLRGRQLPP